MALKYLKYRDLSKFSVWLGIVLNIARVGLNAWDYEIINGFDFPISNNLEFLVRSSVNTPRFHTKSVIWTLQQIFSEYNEREQYSSANFITTVQGQVLGFGSIKSTLESRDDGKTGDSFPDVLVDSLSQANITASSMASTKLSTRRGFEIRIEYLPNGALISPLGFFTTMIRFLVLATNRDPKTSTVKRAAFLNAEEGYFVEVAALYEGEDMALSDIIRSLGILPAKMYSVGTGGRWAELKGTILYDGVKIGKVRIGKGSAAPDGLPLGGGLLLTNGTTVEACTALNGTAVS